MMGHKVNDYKALYGGMFAEELSDKTHWGWFDLDVFPSTKLVSVLTSYLPSMERAGGNMLSTK